MQHVGGELAASGTVQVWPSTPVEAALIDEVDERVCGIRLCDQGVDRQGDPEAGYMPGMDIHAALTVVGDGPVGAVGRQLDSVLSTLHTRDAASTPIRLIDMGTPRYMVASSLQAVIAQRLIRVICINCAEPYQPSQQELQWLHGSARDDGKPLQLMRGRGCQFCHLTGYAGRIGVYEMLEMDAELAAAVNVEDTSAFARLAARHMAGKSMRHHATQLGLTGKTTVAEAIRISFELED